MACVHGERLRGKCKTCRSAYMKEWYARNGDRLRETNLTRSREKRSALKASGLNSHGKPRKPRGRPRIYTEDEAHERNKACFRRYARRRNAQMRSELFAFLGARCRQINPLGCAGDDADVLELDHIGGDGYADRTKNGARRNAGSTTGNAYRELQQHGEAFVRGKYQLLCANCHTRKTKMNGEHRSASRGEVVAEVATKNQLSLLN